MRAFIAGLTLLLLAGRLAAAPPLTDAQRAMLADGTTDGDAVVEQPGLYALLRNALAWDADDERGAAIPDYDAIYADPSAFRGEAVLLEGELLRVGTRSVGRDGPWNDPSDDTADASSANVRRDLAEWIVEVDPARGDVATLWMPDPTGLAATAPTGRPVRLPARFYKLWTTDNIGADGGEGRFLVFVGPTPRLDAPSAGGSSAWLRPLLMFMLVTLGIGILYSIRRAIFPKPKPLPPRRLAHDTSRAADEPTADGDVDADDSLPQDPVEAMRRLAEGHADARRRRS